MQYRVFLWRHTTATATIGKVSAQTRCVELRARVGGADTTPFHSLGVVPLEPLRTLGKRMYAHIQPYLPANYIRIQISGARDRRGDEELLHSHFQIAQSFCPEAPLLVVHGDAVGIDRAAERVALAGGAFVEAHPAPWSYGKQAGKLRNSQMIQMMPHHPGPQLGLCYPMIEGYSPLGTPLHSSGTQHAITLMQPLFPSHVFGREWREGDRVRDPAPPRERRGG